MRITVQGLTKRFGPLEVVSDVGFSIEEGEMFTLLGPSGCGKTTLLRLIAGFYAPDEGEVLFDGRVINDLPPHERGIGMVFQNYALWPHMTVYENAAYGLKLRKVQPAEIGQRIGAVLEKVKLAGLEHRYPGQLSGGQQQRVALARALVLNPKILQLDEPLSNLDAKIRIQVRAEIRTAEELGITTVYAHDQGGADVSDRIAVFNREDSADRPAEGAYERPQNASRRLHRHQPGRGNVEAVDAPQALAAPENRSATLAVMDGAFPRRPVHRVHPAENAASTASAPGATW